MNFLKRIISLAIAVLMVIFLNNLMAFVFPKSDKLVTYDTAYQKCREFQPEYGTPVNSSVPAPIIKGDQTKYDECYREETKKVQDQEAISYQQGLVRAFVVMVLAVGIAAWQFRRYPYLSGGLIGGGVLFLIIYPLMNMSGFLGFGYSQSTSSAVLEQLRLTKLIMASIGFVGLVVADLFFFEKEPKEPTKLA